MGRNYFGSHILYVHLIFRSILWRNFPSHPFLPSSVWGAYIFIQFVRRSLSIGYCSYKELVRQLTITEDLIQKPNTCLPKHDIESDILRFRLVSSNICVNKEAPHDIVNASSSATKEIKKGILENVSAVKTFTIRPSVFQDVLSFNITFIKT